MDDQNNKKPDFRMTVEAQELLKRAIEMQPGDVIDTDEVTAITGRDPEKARGICATVARHMLRERNLFIVFHPKKRGGLYCCHSDERVNYADTSMRTVSRSLKKTARVVAGAPDHELSTADQLRKATAGTMVKLMAAVLGKRKEVAKIEDDRPQTEPLKIGATLTRLFSK